MVAMKILFVTDNFPPEVNAPASRTFEHAREWVKSGHEVTILTTVPNYPKGKIFAGYRNRLWQSEIMEGIRVIRVWSFVVPNSGFLLRVLDYQSLMFSAVLGALFLRRIDVVIGTSPQIFAACAAWMISTYKRIPFIFELRDLWPESIRAVGALKSAWWLRKLEVFELFLYRRATRVVAVTESFRKNLLLRGISDERIRVIKNGVDRSRFRPSLCASELRAELGLQGKFVAGYIGTHGLAHGLETVLEAANLLSLSRSAEDVIFLLIGDGARKNTLLEKAASMKLRNVIFLDSVPKEDVARYWSILDVAIVHLIRDPLFSSVIPSKLFECMGMGIPVLHGVRGEAAEIVQKSGCGELFEPENSEELAEKILALKSDPNRCRRYAEAGAAAASHYDRVRMANDMLRVLEEAVGKA
jgi:glycosyltransferase involved in cell wall biosynthesis